MFGLSAKLPSSTNKRPQRVPLRGPNRWKPEGPDCELGGREYQISSPEGFPYYGQQHVVELSPETREHLLNNFPLCFMRMAGLSSFRNVVLLKWRGL
jgi:hypothetical protein